MGKIGSQSALYLGESFRLEGTTNVIGCTHSTYPKYDEYRYVQQNTSLVLALFA